MSWKIYKLKIKFDDGSSDTTTWPCLIYGDVHVTGEPSLEKISSYYKNFPSLNVIEKRKVLTVIGVDIISNFEIEKL